jgi:hypothetical protein
MKNKKTILLLALVGLLLTEFFILTYPFPPVRFVKNQTFEKYSNLFFIYEVRKYPSGVEIVEKRNESLTIGFVTDPWNLNFGIIPKGSYGTRHLNVRNYEDKKIRVSFNVYGEIKPLVSFSKNNFLLGPNESAYVDVIINATEVTELGNYTGEIDVIVKKIKFDFLFLFL